MDAFAWHAYYFEHTRGCEPPVWSEWIEAPTEEEAMDIARSHMGDCNRIHLEKPRWEGSPRGFMVTRDAVIRTH